MVSEANQVMRTMLDKLNASPQISYQYYRSVNYFSENYHSELNGAIYLDYSITDSLLGFRFMVDSEKHKTIYNGAECFMLNKGDNTMNLYRKPVADDFSSLSLFANSIVTLKKALPKIIEDDNITKSHADTTVNGSHCHLVTFILKDKTLDYLGGYFHISEKRDIIYHLIIDKSTSLPLQVIQRNNVLPQDYVLTSFSAVNLSPDSPAENTWYYSDYSDKFLLSSKTKLELIKEKTKSPDWKLPIYGDQETIGSGNLVGKAVLLEFWMKNCGPCIASIPKLNALKEKYRTKNLEIIGINMQDNQDAIGKFYEKNHPQFRTAMDKDGSVTTSFGVSAFPTVVLLDKTGSVVYAGGFDHARIESLLMEIVE